MELHCHKYIWCYMRTSLFTQSGLWWVKHTYNPRENQVKITQRRIAENLLQEIKWNVKSNQLTQKKVGEKETNETIKEAKIENKHQESSLEPNRMNHFINCKWIRLSRRRQRWVVQTTKERRRNSASGGPGEVTPCKDNLLPATHTARRQRQGLDAIQGWRD